MNDFFDIEPLEVFKPMGFEEVDPFDYLRPYLRCLQSQSIWTRQDESIHLLKDLYDTYGVSIVDEDLKSYFETYGSSCERDSRL